MNKPQMLLQLKNAGLSIKRKEKLKNLNLVIRAGDYTGIYGLNGSGKSLLSELIGGALKTGSAEIIKRDGLKTAVVSSAEQKRMLEEDRHNDDSEFMEGKTDPGRTVTDILRLTMDQSAPLNEIKHYVKLFEINHIMDRGIKFLSTGEFRKMMIVRALLSKPDIIVLDDPYTGLDIETRHLLAGLILEIKSRVKALMLVSGRLDDIKRTEKKYLLHNMTLLEFKTENDVSGILGNDNPLSMISDESETNELGITSAENQDCELIRMNNVRMSYYDEKILTDINWTVKNGEHWQISGPNGSGKSSLLSLVNGDSPKAYGQDIYLFGIKRGSGETIWDIKQRIGYVSGTLQKEHRITQNVFNIVISGFFDTIGLYDRPDPVQVEKARGWCAEFGVADYLQRPFDSLSEGMKRAVLIIRAIVKRPQVLILDEPCQGLDDHNSGFVLAVAKRVIKHDHSVLLYVSHDPYYRMEEITNTLELVPHPDGGYTGKIKENL